MLKLVAFDFDGTVADTLKVATKVFQDAVSPFIGHELSFKEVSRTFGMNERGMIMALGVKQVDEAEKAFYDLYEKTRVSDGPFEGIVSLIGKLKAKGLKVVLVTGKGEVTCALSLKQIGLQNTFEKIYTGSTKPDGKADALGAVMRDYNLEASEMVYIGDAVSDVVSAHSRGIRCLSAAWCDTADFKALTEVNESMVFKTVEDVEKELLSKTK